MDNEDSFPYLLDQRIAGHIDTQTFEVFLYKG